MRRGTRRARYVDSWSLSLHVENRRAAAASPASIAVARRAAASDGVW